MLSHSEFRIHHVSLEVFSLRQSFSPSIVQELGFTAARAQLMSVPPFAAAFVGSFHHRYDAKTQSSYFLIH